MKSGGSITANFAVLRSTEAATLHETVTVDSGPDPGQLGAAAADFSGNLQIDLPAGQTRCRPAGHPPHPATRGWPCKAS